MDLMVGVDTGSPSEPSQPRVAHLRLPQWMWGSNLAGFADAGQWNLRQVDDTVWSISVRERSDGDDPPDLLVLDRVVDAHRGHDASTGRRLARLPRSDAQWSDDLRQIAFDEITRLDGLYPGDPATWLYGAALAIQASPDGQLQDLLVQVIRDRIVPNHCPRAAAHTLTVSTALPYRYALPRILLQVEDDPGLLERAPEDFRGFNSARGLFSDTTLGLDAYIAPLLSSLAPHLWGFPATRIGTVVVVTLGQAISGRRGPASDPLDLLLPHGRGGSGPAFPELSPKQCGAALSWWVDQLTRLFTEVTDPTNYVDDLGDYQHRRAFERMLSLEQAFRHVQALSAHDRDPHTRRVMMFQSLDTLEGLKLLDFHTMCTASRAEAVLESLRQTIPADAQPVLLPRAERGVAALQELQDGFFLPSRVSPTEGVRVKAKQGHDEYLPPERAAATWLRIVRNAQHGFGGREQLPGRDDVLLASHDGEIPEHLPDLAWLYLLRLVAQPSLLAPQVYRRPSAPPAG